VAFEPLVADWIIPAFLGLGLAAATGLKTFLPLLMLALTARLGLFGIELSEGFAWLGSTAALTTLAIATAAEIAADKIPIVDNALSLFGTVVRPAAGWLAAAAAFGAADPLPAAIAGLIIGAPTALAFNAAQGGTRAVSTVATGGLGNPMVSVVEDALAFFLALVALAAPLLIPLALVAILWAALKLAQRAWRRSDASRAP
jgi:hypothetical protein